MSAEVVTAMVCVAVIMLALATAPWLKREGDRNWERMRPDRVRVTLTLDFTQFEAAMARAAAAVKDLGQAFRKIHPENSAYEMCGVTTCQIVRPKPGEGK